MLKKIFAGCLSLSATAIATAIATAFATAIATGSAVAHDQPHLDALGITHFHGTGIAVLLIAGIVFWRFLKRSRNK